MLNVSELPGLMFSSLAVFDMRKGEFGEFREYRCLNRSDHGNQLFFSRADLEHLNLSGE